MIHPVLKFLAEQLNIYIDKVKKPSDGITSPLVILQKISQLAEDDLETTNNILITTVNLSEESTLKNSPGHEMINNDLVKYRNPPENRPWQGRRLQRTEI
jgi:hypothetical protein